MSLALHAMRRRPSYLLACRLAKHWARCQTTASIQTTDYLTLPPHSEWRTVFNPAGVYIRDRVSLANPDTARLVAKSLLSGKSIAAGKDKIVIEAFPGPGALSRALLALKQNPIKKLIILEESEGYLPYLRALAKNDPRVILVEMSGYQWETYIYLEEQGILDDVKNVPWDGGVHPQLHFISHIPHNAQGEQLVAQFFRNIPDRSWLFKYGRVPMSFVLGEWIWGRVTAPVGDDGTRCKVSVIAEATAETQVSLPPSKLLPYDKHFHPRAPKNSTDRRPGSRRQGHPLVAASVVPYEQQVILPGLLDKWDYCLRRLFVRKGTPLKTAITTLGPGAESLLKVLTDPSLPTHEHVDITKAVRALNIADWALVIRAFDNWPFAPETLSLHEAFSTVNRHTSRA